MSKDGQHRVVLDPGDPAVLQVQPDPENIGESDGIDSTGNRPTQGTHQYGQETRQLAGVVFHDLAIYGPHVSQGLTQIADDRNQRIVGGEVQAQGQHDVSVQAEDARPAILHKDVKIQPQLWNGHGQQRIFQRPHSVFVLDESIGPNLDARHLLRRHGDGDRCIVSAGQTQQVGQADTQSARTQLGDGLGGDGETQGAAIVDRPHHVADDVIGDPDSNVETLAARIDIATQEVCSRRLEHLGLGALGDASIAVADRPGNDAQRKAPVLHVHITAGEAEVLDGGR